MRYPLINKASAGACSVALVLILSTTATAGDARSIALGGSTIASGQGVHGAVENPASLMAMMRREENLHFRIGLTANILDKGNAIDLLTDENNKDLINDIDKEVDTLSQSVVRCDPIAGNGDDTCVDNTQGLADLANRLLDILNKVDNQTMDGQASLDMGAAFTSNEWPVGINLRVSATAAALPAIVEGDRAYISDLTDVLGDNNLTLDEARTSPFLEANAQGAALQVTQPEDVLLSEAQGSALTRAQLGVSIARTVVVGGHSVDVGLTPKISSLMAYSIAVNAPDEFKDETESIKNRLDDSKTTKTTFTFDAGASMMLPKAAPVRVAAVLRNVVPESIKTNNDFEFETTPQLVIGALYQKDLFSVTGDLALNEGKVDNFESQKISLGLEFGTSRFAVRGGISTDLARDEDATSLSLGFGLGPLQVGGRLNGLQALEAGIQVAHSF